MHIHNNYHETHFRNYYLHSAVSVQGTIHRKKERPIKEIRQILKGKKKERKKISLGLPAAKVGADTQKVGFLILASSRVHPDWETSEERDCLNHLRRRCGTLLCEMSGRR